MKSIKRRNFIQGAIIGSLGSVFATGVHAKKRTPSEVEGPFYPITPQKDKDADLTRVTGRDGIANGEIIEISGQVYDQNSNPVEDVTVDLWQANSHGRYHHPHDNSSEPVDENFQAWAILQSGKDGRFKFKTVIPGAYAIGATSVRTPHIHFKISKKGYESVLTQMYFPNHPLNSQDGLFRRKAAQEQALMTAKQIQGSNQYLYDIFILKY